MATLLLSAAGSALGGSLGGSLAGLTTGMLGKAAGASLGSMIDQRLTGLGSEPVETGRVERFRIMGASEGAPLPRVFGRMRVAGQVIWSSRFLENVNSSSVGGKGGAQARETREFTYSISLALALCEGEVARVGRVWADGQALDLAGVIWRLHTGAEDQLPDPVIAAIEGEGNAPAYRGTAYVVVEDLDLSPFGNRVPQFNFEIFRRSPAMPGLPRPAALDVAGVALVPGTGEYSLATTPVYFNFDKGHTAVANVNNDRGEADLKVSIDQLQAELPAATKVSLVVSWFGDDLRCDRCRLVPKVEQTKHDGDPMPWLVSGVPRAEAEAVTRVDGRPFFGGTPADAAVVEAIRHIAATGRSVMFYPFILMDVPVGNDLPNPWTPGTSQPVAPWRGRITLSAAPGQSGSSDRTAGAAVEVAAFFGSAQVEDFQLRNGTVAYSGPREWSYRRFILHYAHLCKAAGGVEAFCIGSEMRSLTQIRDGRHSYPAVRALCDLARDVRIVLGAGVKIGYAADWSEYFGHRPEDMSDDLAFHLDGLWAHEAVDFIGIDNYMPLSDWREGSSHKDAGAGSIYSLDYLKANVAGGEGFDWYYATTEARDLQERLPIKDERYGEEWTFRYKDIKNWWSRPHFNRTGGVKAATATPWIPRSKPIWFTEVGCPAVDKGTNQPNVFFDPKSSESYFPYYSNGTQDDLIQRRYLQAIFSYWNEPTNNPVSDQYGGQMIDMSHAYVWAWDARPWPDFPDRMNVWADGANFARGHWLNSKAALPDLSEVVTEICQRSGVAEMEAARLSAAVTGYQIAGLESGRQSLQPLMLAYAFDCHSDGSRLTFVRRGEETVHQVELEDLVVGSNAPAYTATRDSNAASAGRVSFSYVRADEDYQVGAAAATSPDAIEPRTSQADAQIAMTDGQAQVVAERWLIEGQLARDTIKFDLPMSKLEITSGDLVAVRLGDQGDRYRVDKVEDATSRAITGIRVDSAIYGAPAPSLTRRTARLVAVQTPVSVDFLDLPLLTGEENPVAPHVAVAKSPWSGPVAIFSALGENGFRLNQTVMRPATVGSTLTPLPRREAGRWARQEVRVRLATGLLGSVGSKELLAGSNTAAIRSDITADWEIIQFSSATLSSKSEYVLSGLLRGQAGTDGVAAEEWPVGSDFVLLNNSIVQLNLGDGDRGLARIYRVGPATRPYSDGTYLQKSLTFRGIGLRPYRPAHLAARRMLNGDLRISWVRRTRIGGDGWDSLEIPLGEQRETYSVSIQIEGSDARTFVATRCEWIVSSADLPTEAATSGLSIHVAQVTDAFGEGPSAHLLWREVDADLIAEPQLRRFTVRSST